MGAATQNAQRTKLAAAACSHLMWIVWVALGAALGAAIVLTTVPTLRHQQRALWRHGACPFGAARCCLAVLVLTDSAATLAWRSCALLRRRILPWRGGRAMPAAAATIPASPCPPAANTALCLLPICRGWEDEAAQGLCGAPRAGARRAGGWVCRCAPTRQLPPAELETLRMPLAALRCCCRHRCPGSPCSRATTWTAACNSTAPAPASARWPQSCWRASPSRWAAVVAVAVVVAAAAARWQSTSSYALVRMSSPHAHTHAPQVFALGGSVTWGRGASRPELAYPARFFSIINASFPHR